MVQTVTPYITPQMLINAPTGVAWQIIPEPGSDSAAQLAEQTNICNRATSMIDTYCNQVLRATVDNEELYGPGNSIGRVGIQRGSGNGILVMRRWPVIEALAIQTAPNSVWPRVWSTIPSGMYGVEHPLINAYTDTAAATAPDGGSTILVAPTYMSLPGGRNSMLVLVSYTNGWPHTSLTAAADAEATVLNVDDVTGFTGATAMVYDGSSTETVSIASVSATTPLALPNGVGTAQTGPGTVTLTSPLASAHDAGVVVSALPANVIWAAAIAAAAQALESGIVSITIQNMPGSVSTGGKGSVDLQTQFERYLNPYRRIV